MTKVPYFNLNKNIKNLTLSATLNINELSNDLLSRGKKIYKFGLGQSPFPVPDCVVSSLKKNAYQKDYLQVSGLYQLRKSIIEHLYSSQGIVREINNVLIAPGSKELMFILQVVYDADLVLPSPSWVSYEPQARIIGRKVHWIDTKRENKWKLTPEALEEHCKKHLKTPQILLLNYPNNPHGYTYTTHELKLIAKIAQKYQMLVLSDEIYSRIHHDGDHISIAKYYPNGTIISSGLSKWCGAGGWRLGFFAFPKTLSWIKDAMKIIASETYTSVSAPIQYAAIRAYQGGEEIDDYLQNSRKVLKALGCFIAQKFRDIGVEIDDPEGGFYLFPDLSRFGEKFKAEGINTSKALCEKILVKTGVAMLPGSDFGRSENEYTMRLAYIDFNGAKVLKAARAVKSDTLDEKFVIKNCPNCVEAIDRICSWLIDK